VRDKSTILKSLHAEQFSFETNKGRVVMSQHTLSIAPGVIIEHVGADLMVMVPGSTEVIKLSGDAAHTIHAIQAEATPVLPSGTVSELIDRGIVVSQAGMSRRGLITAGALGAGAGVVMLSMPAAAAAGSGPELNGGNGDVDDEDDDKDDNGAGASCLPGTPVTVDSFTYDGDDEELIVFVDGLDINEVRSHMTINFADGESIGSDSRVAVGNLIRWIFKLTPTEFNAIKDDFSSACANFTIGTETFVISSFPSPTVID